MTSAFEDMICVGDAKQLDYCKQRYNYLFAKLQEIEVGIEGKIYKGKSLTQLIPKYAKMRAEMLNLDELRTVIFLSVKNKAGE